MLDTLDEILKYMRLLSDRAIHKESHLEELLEKLINLNKKILIILTDIDRKVTPPIVKSKITFGSPTNK